MIEKFFVAGQQVLMSDQLHKQHTDEAAEAPAAAAAAALVRLSFGQSVPSTPLVGKDFGVVVSADRFGLEIELFCSLVAAADAPECDSPGGWLGGSRGNKTRLYPERCVRNLLAIETLSSSSVRVLVPVMLLLFLLLFLLLLLLCAWC